MLLAAIVMHPNLSVLTETQTPATSSPSPPATLKKRYGFIDVDADNAGNGTYDRIKKDSFHWYRKVISTNGTDLT